MLGSLFRRAQATVDNAIDNVVNRALVAIPFLVAAGFGTAALSMRLNREFGAETGSLILCGGFVVVGLFVALIVHSRAERPAETIAEDADAAQQTAEEAAADPSLANVDRELLMAALTTAAPIALPGLLRTLMRNLPIVAAIAAAGFIMSRNTEPDILEPGE
jgi:predicted histidine transporter YuiF (NhaC family)